MQLGLDTISVIFAFVALIISLFTWLFPRNPKKNKIPEYFGEISKEYSDKILDFIVENDDRIVKFRAHIPMQEEEIFTENDDDDGNVYHNLTLKNKPYKGLSTGGMEVSISPEKGEKASPVIFANGAYHLNGFFVVKIYPGVFQGFIGANLTEVSAEQMALRS